MHKIGFFSGLLLVAAISLVTQTGCVSSAPAAAAASSPEAKQISTLQAEVAGLQAQVASLTSEVAAAQAELAAAQADAAATQAQLAAAQADAAATQAALSDAEAAVTSAQEVAGQAQAETAQVQAEVDALLAAAASPGIMVSPAQLDVSLLDLDSAQVSLAGPDTIYVSSIMYDGQPYSALLKYHGGTTATVERVYGSGATMIPDSVELSQTKLSFVAPDVLDVANVDVSGNGYSGQLRYTGGNELEVAGIQRVTLPPTAAQQIAALQQELAAAQSEAAQAQAAASAAEAATSEAEAATAAAAGAARAEAAAAQDAAAVSQAAAAAAQAKVEMMQAEAYQPSAVMVTAEGLDAGLLSFAGAQASLAGPDRVYVSSIEYDGQSYSALLRYRGGTTATVEQVYGPSGKLIPDTVGLSQTELAFVAPDVLDIAYVEVGGQGYSGQLRYAGSNRLEVAGIRRVLLPPTAAQQVSAAEAAAAAAVADAQAGAAAAVAEAQAAAAAAVSEAEAATAAAEAAAGAARAEAAAAQDAAAVSQAEAAAAQAKVEMMQAEAYQASAVMVTAEGLDASLLSLAGAQATLAGPDRVYVSSIEYDGQSYSALLRYRGGTTATVEQVYGPSGKLIPDTVGLSQTELAFVAPDVLDIAYVEVGGQGYSGQLRYAGSNRLEVAGIRRVRLPPTAAQQVSAAEAAAAAAVADAQAGAAAAVAEAQAAAAAAVSEAEAATAAAEAAAGAARAEATEAQAKVEMMQAEAYQPSAVMVSAEGLDASLLSLAGAQASLAGPDRVYVSSIEYDGQSYSALLRYRGGTTATVEQVYGPSGKLIPDTVGLSQTELAFVAPDVLDIAYVEVGGQATRGSCGTREATGWRWRGYGGCCCRRRPRSRYRRRKRRKRRQRPRRQRRGWPTRRPGRQQR